MRWLRSGLVVGVLAGLGVLAPATPACACSCVAMTAQEAVAAADAVFVGTVVEIDAPATGPIFSSMDPVTVTFEVSTVYKGDVPANAQVQTVSSEVSCGYEFHDRTRYLVHVHIDQAGEWTTGLCNGNQVLPAETRTSDASTAPPQVVLPTGGYAPGPPTNDPRWAWVIVPIGALAGATAVLLLVRARRRRTAIGAP